SPGRRKEGRCSLAIRTMAPIKRAADTPMTRALARGLMRFRSRSVLEAGKAEQSEPPRFMGLRCWLPVFGSGENDHVASLVPRQEFGVARQPAASATAGDRGDQEDAVAFLQAAGLAAQEANVFLVEVDVEELADLTGVVADVARKIGES